MMTKFRMLRAGTVYFYWLLATDDRIGIRSDGRETSGQRDHRNEREYGRVLFTHSADLRRDRAVRPDL